jgi:hypothetical protein
VSQRDADYREFHRQYPSARTLTDLIKQTEKQYDREHPRLWKNVTKEQAVAAAVDAFGKFVTRWPDSLSEPRTGGTK